MRAWKIALAAALPAALLVAIAVLIGCYRHTHGESNPRHRRRGPYAGVLRLRERTLDSAPKHSKRVASVWKNNFSYPIKAFSWNDHPSLVAEAVEHGWATFAFTNTCSACPPVNSNLWDLCTGCSNEEEIDADISWEMGSGCDYMQKIRLNPGLRMKKNANLLPPVQSLQTALPLPGPPLGPLSFPQEAYLEITIVSEDTEQMGSMSGQNTTEGEHVKLISQSFNSDDHHQPFEVDAAQLSNRGDLDANYKANSGKKGPRSNSSGLDHGSREIQLSVTAAHPKVMSLGLTAGGGPSYRLPGCDPGSVGFLSTGFVFLNGMAHLNNDPQQQKPPNFTKRAWGSVNTVIGCGFDPANRRVFYTLNGELVYSLTCKSDEFCSPLYPTIAANYDVTVLVNFGQSCFEYSPANAQRVSDPCFRRSLLLPSSLKLPTASIYEDSGDLFSMGRIDSQRLGDVENSNSADLQHKHILSETESDLFEIVLDSIK